LDVDAATGHVRGDGDAAETPGLGDDLGLARVLFGVEHLVIDAALREQTTQVLAPTHAGGADEDRLALLVAGLDVVDDRFELRLLALEDEVGLVSRPAIRVAPSLSTA
jgi:hypothetical protein